MTELPGVLVAKGNAQVYLGYTAHHMSGDIGAIGGIAQILSNPLLLTVWSYHSSSDANVGHGPIIAKGFVLAK